MISISTGIRPLLRISPSALVVALLVSSAASTAVSAPITLDDIIALIEAGVGEKVIIKQIEMADNTLLPTVEALIQLKAAGASDDLLAALLDPPEPGTDGEPSAADEKRSESVDPSDPQFRVYTELDGKGNPVLHITNLDASGRRLGGEVEQPSYPNILQPSPRSPEPSHDDDPYADYEGPTPSASKEPGVVVNVYPPEQTTPQVAEEYEDPYYRAHFHGFVPEYLGYGYPSYGNGYPYYRVGYGVGYYRYNHFPPGSYTHFLRYHHTGDGPHLRRYNVAPYTYDNAAARNRVYFRRR